MEVFDEIKEMYAKALFKHGDSPSSLLTPKGRNKLRFRAVGQQINRGGIKILDYGCGLGDYPKLAEILGFNKIVAYDPMYEEEHQNSFKKSGFKK